MEQCLNLIVFIWILGRVSRNRGVVVEWGGVLDTTHSISQPLGSNCFLLGHCIRNDFPPSEGVVFLGVTY